MKWLLLIMLPSIVFAGEFKPIKVDQKKGYDLVKSEKCDIHISFGSYGSGTPFKVKKKIDSHLQESNSIKEAYSWYWGKEGEHDYCLVLKDESQIKEMFNDLKMFIPEHSKKGYTQLKAKGNLKWSTTWPK